MTTQEANSLPLQSVWQRVTGMPAPEYGRKCLAPYRPDKNPGCILKTYNGQDYFHDWPDGKPKNVIRFTARCLQLNNESSEGFKEVIQWLEAEFGTGNQPFKPSKKFEPIRLPEPVKTEWKAYGGELYTPTDNQLAQILSARNSEVSLPGLSLATERGHLYAGIHRGHACFAVTDQTRRSIDFRRLDGNGFVVKDSERKVDTPFGTSKKWPIGVKEMAEGDFQQVMVVGSSSDLLSAHKAIYSEGRHIDRPGFPKVAVVALLGEKNNFTAQCLQYFSGKHIWIYPDNDATGRDAAKRWFAQLDLVASEVQVFEGIKKATRRDGQTFKDFGDFMSVRAQELIGYSGLVCPH